jgi:hypothetical protein
MQVVLFGTHNRINLVLLWRPSIGPSFQWNFNEANHSCHPMLIDESAYLRQCPDLSGIST